MRARTRQRTLRIGAAVALSAALAGCAEGQAAEPGPTVSGPPPVTGVPTMLEVGSLVLPIEPYLFTDRQVARLFRARAVLTASCMERFGHRWPVPTETAPDTGTLNPANTAHRYGITDARLAARYGYHPAPGSAPSRSKEKSEGPNPGPEEMLLLTGLRDDGTPAGKDELGRAIPAGGCQGEATAALSGDPEKIGNRELVGTINIGSYSDSQKDPRVVEVFRAWSRCMKRHGHQYADPTQAPGKDPEFTGPKATRAEIALAGTDVRCKRETNVVGVWSSVDAAYQRRAMSSKTRELAAIKRDIRRQVTNADRVLRTG
ncbi:hypothetical protein GCM10010306_067420 [Streptomyces umbrinus]|uniref:hypothetical protein n=1 Tax=Streptomyces umbrinus TaxID=67370 RepID=UPI001679753D|nr:hypothetical protein [Streptomyces umbrinus]GHB64447.1 hypothetical protein GCM10010306_067420 [Streptomyces umbrinus]